MGANLDKFENSIVFQQDGAPLHVFRFVIDWLDKTYPECGPLEWPARLLDLTPLDSFFEVMSN